MTQASTPIEWQLSGFGDEIDPDPDLQCAVLAALGARLVEVRSAWGVNVIDLSDEQLHDLAARLHARGMAVSAVASPIGKVSVALPVSHELDRLERALHAAQVLSAPYIRLFSFYPEAGEPHAAMREAVMERMRALTRRAEQTPVVLLHENEKDIYGDTPERVLDIMRTVESPTLRVAWDSANFVQVGCTRPHSAGYALLRPYLEYLQVKDAVAGSGLVVPAGAGDGQLLETIAALAADGFNGVASLEPHLATQHELGGFSGPHAFGVAARAFRALTEQSGITLT